MRTTILKYIEKNSRVDLGELAVLLGTDEVTVANEIAQMEKEKGVFDMDDVADGICKKLIFRHPHIFGDVTVGSTDEILSNWDDLKRKEKKQETDTSTLESVSKSLPSLIRAQKLQKKAAKVGIGWTARSCGHCDACISGNQINCLEGSVPTILNRGGFANKLRADWQWVIPLPESIDLASAGPMLCGGITVFKPLLTHHVTATSRVGVIGIGGLGHIAIKLLRAMGAEVTAFSSNPAKEQEVLAMGADRVVNSRDPEALKALAGQFDLIINTVAVDLDWQPYFEALAYGGNFHTVGAVMKPFPVPAFTLIGGDRSISGSATGNPSELRTLMKFAGRSKVAPTTELFPMSQINEALKHVREGKARYRAVLKADF